MNEDVKSILQETVFFTCKKAKSNRRRPVIDKLGSLQVSHPNKACQSRSAKTLNEHFARDRAQESDCQQKSFCFLDDTNSWQSHNKFRRKQGIQAGSFPHQSI
jgi:hypothetical protein